jgi:diguanylate cyclase (GGDEF)-like protein
LSKRGWRFIQIGILATAYFVTGKLGLRLAILHPSASAVWPTSGIALAALLIFDMDIWPGILIGAFFVNLTTAGSITTSIGIAFGNTLEALAGAWLIRRFADGEDCVFRGLNILKFTILGAMLSTSLSATIGVTSLALGGFAEWNNYWPLWLTWWLGDAVGDLIIAPVLLILASRQDHPWSWSRIRPEAIALLVAVVLVGQVIFNGILLTAVSYPLEYLCMPFLAWAALRFGQRETAVAMVVFATSAIWGTLSGFGPFQRGSMNESLVLLQAFLGVVAVMTTVLSAEVAQRRRAEAVARSLAVSDPLTGLGNHRKLIEAIEFEIRRGDRTKRVFAILFIDVDNLKMINDTHGHLEGNRALCRVADTLRVQCRGSDVTGRYGGDEFVVVLPETDRETARAIADRIQAAVRKQPETPSLSVSVGAAVWPNDGMTIDDLMMTADAALYEAKKRGKGLPLARRPGDTL